MTITLTREEAQQVLDALICSGPHGWSPNLVNQHNKALKTLRARLAQPEPETCGYDETTGNCTQNPCCYPSPPQREWRGLTTAETKALWNATKKPTEFAEMLQAKLKEKNAANA